MSRLHRALILVLLAAAGPMRARSADKVPDVLSPNPVKDTPSASPDANADTAEAHEKKGRSLFQAKSYQEAYKEFSAAVALNPRNRKTRFVMGLAAYWARQPAKALEIWNQMLDTAKRKTTEEWDLERHRVMALSALGQLDTAEEVVGRLYELRREVKLPAAVGSRGFVREHFYFKNLRVGVWEVFDERHEVQDLWSFPAVSGEPETVVKRLAVQAAQLPGGPPGFVLIEEGEGYRRVFKRWVKRPEYAEVRTLVLQALNGTLKALEDTKVESAPTIPAATDSSGQKVAAPLSPAPDAGKPSTPAPPVRLFTASEDRIAEDIKGWGLDGDVTKMLIAASRLKDIDFDVTRLTRLSQTDTDMAGKYLKDLAARLPYAQQDAAELVDLVAKAKSDHLTAFFTYLKRLGARKPYVDFALLTGLNTRGGDSPTDFLDECLKHTDFMVRQTCAVIASREGDRRGLDLLFKELTTADAVNGAILQVSIEELLGASIPPPPKIDEKNDAPYKAWQKMVGLWWVEHNGKLVHNPDPKLDEPFWSEPKK